MQTTVMNQPQAYESFLRTLSRTKWERIGVKRRSGVATPLFSLHSAKSTGLGELPDLKLLVDWCGLVRMSIIQLLPMNDVGFSFTPYDAQSTYALDPMYLRLSEIAGVDLRPFGGEIESLRKQFPPGGARVNYQVKKAKLDLLWKIFQKADLARLPDFQEFVSSCKFWLEDYVAFKVIKELKHEESWERWDAEIRRKDASVVHHLLHKFDQRRKFHEWLQWQLFLQFKAVKEYAGQKGIFIMGDLPFLVSRDSAEVWAHQNYFKLGLSSGAPPDMYFAKGQRWGMPPYHWHEIAQHDYDYVREKLKYAENFYDLYRIDHVVGIFRVWTIALSEPPESVGLKGIFDPPDEAHWEGQGRKLLSIMIESTQMLPCAEDLGVVPECSNRVLEDLGMVGMDVQRWSKEWKTNCDFKAGGEYRKNSIAVISTHDMTSLRGWWEFEAGTVDGALFERVCESKGISFESVKDRLFDLNHSHHGRMRWREEISDLRKLSDILGRPEQEIGELIDMHKGSYAEKEKFLHFLSHDPAVGGPTPAVSGDELIRRALQKISETASIFSVQLLQDWLSLDPAFKHDPWHFRINFPGTFSDKNWSLVMPLSLENMLELKINEQIRAIHEVSSRI